MDMSKFDVILGMDWLTAHLVVIDCDRMRVKAYTLDGTCVMFQGDKHDTLPRAVYDSKWNGQLIRWLESLTLEDEVRQDLNLPRVICDYEDVFSDELSGLPPYRDVDFVIELHPGTSPISMTPHRMEPIELQELKVQLQELKVTLYHPGKANVVADALIRKSRGVLASIASREWQMLETVGQFGLQYSDQA